MNKLGIIIKNLMIKMKYILNPNISNKSILEDSFIFGIYE